MNKNLILLIVVALAGVGFIRYNSVTTPSPLTPTISTAPDNAVQEPRSTYTLADVAEHNNKSDCWLIIEGKVYDVTKFIPSHPGGEKILNGCGKDATSLFQGNPLHGQNNAAQYLPTYYIGDLQ